MPEITVAHRPELTLDRALGAFRDEFGDRYEVREARLLGIRRITVNKTSWVGVTVDLRHTRDRTIFSYRGYIPSTVYNLLLGGFIAMMILRSRWRELENEVRAFIEAAPAFN